VLEFLPCEGDHCFEGEELKKRRDVIAFLPYFEAQEFNKEVYDSGVVRSSEIFVKTE